MIATDRLTAISFSFTFLWTSAAVLAGANPLGFAFAAYCAISGAVALVANRKTSTGSQVSQVKREAGHILSKFPALSWPVVDTVSSKLGQMNNLRSGTSKRDDETNDYEQLLDYYGLNGAVVVDLLNSQGNSERQSSNVTDQGLAWQYANGTAVVVSSVDISTATDLIHAAGQFGMDEGLSKRSNGNWVSYNFDSKEVV